MNQLVKSSLVKSFISSFSRNCTILKQGICNEQKKNEVHLRFFENIIENRYLKNS